MKIIKLQAENVKRLRVVEINPTGEVIELTGRNGQGKTSVLDSIWWALGGTENIQDQPIRTGAKKASIKLQLGPDAQGDLIVERRFNEGKPSQLIVSRADGARYNSPQTMLDALIGQLTFDPLAFARMPARSQFDELKRIVNVSVDLEKLEALNRADYDRRTELNRDAKALRARAEGINVPEGLPENLIDESLLLGEMEGAAQTNADIQRRGDNRKRAQEESFKLRHDAEQLYKSSGEKRDSAIADAEFKHREARDAAERAYKRALEEADAALARAKVSANDDLKKDEESINRWQAQANDLKKQLNEASPLPALVDTAALRQKIEDARRVNAGIGKRLERAKLEEQAKRLEASSTELTASMEAREQAKRDAIAAAKMPVEGLSFGAGVVTFNGVPFEQASDAEKLRVSLTIAMDANPKLRIVRIRDGSLLDKASMEQLHVMAKNRDFQIWVERVDDSGEIGIVIEDGMVAKTN